MSLLQGPPLLSAGYWNDSYKVSTCLYGDILAPYAPCTHFNSSTARETRCLLLASCHNPGQRVLSPSAVVHSRQRAVLSDFSFCPGFELSGYRRTVLAIALPGGKPHTLQKAAVIINVCSLLFIGKSVKRKLSELVLAASPPSTYSTYLQILYLLD